MSETNSWKNKSIHEDLILQSAKVVMISQGVSDEPSSHLEQRLLGVPDIMQMATLYKQIYTYIYRKEVHWLLR